VDGSDSRQAAMGGVESERWTEAVFTDLDLLLRMSFLDNCSVSVSAPGRYSF